MGTCNDGLTITKPSSTGTPAAFAWPEPNPYVVRIYDTLPIADRCSSLDPKLALLAAGHAVDLTLRASGAVEAVAGPEHVRGVDGDAVVSACRL